MSSFEWNKVIASVLTAMIVAMVAGVLASQLVHPHQLHEAAYLPPGAEGGATTAAATAPAAASVEPIEPLLASADVAHGQQLSKVCTQCHTFEKGGANKIGPNIYAVVERARASHEGFAYSGAMKEKGGNWSYDELFHFLRSPGAYIPGTKMSFAGIRNGQDRINLVAFLRTL